MKIKNMIIILLSLIICLSFVNIVSASNSNSGYVKATILNQDPDPAEPGDYVEIRWKVEKYGNGGMEDITFILDVDYPFSFDASDTAEKIIGNWKGYSNDEEYYILYYKLRVDENAIEDNYKLKLKSTNNNKEIWNIEEYDIRVAKKDKPEFTLGTLITSPTKLISDTDEAELKIELENIGDGDAENVKIDVEFPNGFTATYGYSDRANLGNIESGSSKTATFYVDIAEETSGGEHKAKLTINYKEANDDHNKYKTKIIYLDIPLKRKPTFEINSIKSDPVKIKANSVVELKLTIKNIGGNKAESVSIRVFKESSQPFEFIEKTDFVGNLKPGETGEAILKFTVDKKATSKNYLLNLEVRCIDGDKVIVQDKIIKISVLKDEKKGIIGVVTGAFIKTNEWETSIGTGVFMLILIIIVGIGTYYIGWKHGKNK